MRLLTPTENRRLNELIGFLGLTLAVLMALALLSYSPHDASFNVSAQRRRTPIAARNWIGPVGAYGADLIFQAFGYAAFLLPLGIFGLGWRWLRSQAAGFRGCEAGRLRAAGAFVPRAADAVAHSRRARRDSARRVAGHAGRRRRCSAGFNSVGAHVVALALFVTALFLATPFSFTGTHGLVRGPLRNSIRMGRLKARWAAWHEEREQERNRKRLEDIKMSGRQPVPTQTVGAQESWQDCREAQRNATGRGTPHEPTRCRIAAPWCSFCRSRRAAAAAKKRAPPNPRSPAARRTSACPPPDLLRMAERSEKIQEDELKECARAIEQKCREFDVGGHVTQINPGPVVTTYEFKPEAGIKYSRITGLADDLCLALRAESILIERIPGKSTVGIEVPNQHRQTITLREVIESPEFVNSPSQLTLALGKDLIGRIRVSDLAQMPHLLIAGSTGTGKSVFLNSLIVSMLYKATPDELKLVMVDPKRLELGLYEDIPHLLAPVVTDPKVASNVLRNAMREMERRLKLLAQRGVRNIDQYNRTFAKGQSLSLFENLEEEEHKPAALHRHRHRRIGRPDDGGYQQRRGIHHAPGANGARRGHPPDSGHAAAVGRRDHRPDQGQFPGAHLVPRGQQSGFAHHSRRQRRRIAAGPRRHALSCRRDLRGCIAFTGRWSAKTRSAALCDFWRAQAKAVYNEKLARTAQGRRRKRGGAGGEGGEEEVDDELYQEAVRVVCEMGRASTSTLQRRLRIGYGRAARLIDIMEKDGIVGPRRRHQAARSAQEERLDARVRRIG